MTNYSPYNPQRPWWHHSLWSLRHTLTKYGLSLGQRCIIPRFRSGAQSYFQMFPVKWVLILCMYSQCIMLQSYLHKKNAYLYCYDFDVLNFWLFPRLLMVKKVFATRNSWHPKWFIRDLSALNRFVNSRPVEDPLEEYSRWLLSLLVWSCIQSSHFQICVCIFM